MVSLSVRVLPMFYVFKYIHKLLLCTGIKASIKNIYIKITTPEPCCFVYGRLCGTFVRNNQLVQFLFFVCMLLFFTLVPNTIMLVYANHTYCGWRIAAAAHLIMFDEWFLSQLWTESFFPWSVVKILFRDFCCCFSFLFSSAPSTSADCCLVEMHWSQACF